MAWTFNDFWTHVDSQTLRSSSWRDYLMVKIVMLLASNHPPALHKIFTLKWWFVSHSMMTGMRVNKRILLWIMDTVCSSKVRGVGPNDKVCGKPTRSRGFEARGFYLFFYPPTCSFPRRLVWQLKVPLRVAFISWSTSLERFLPLITFAKRVLLFLIGVTCVRCVRSW